MLPTMKHRLASPSDVIDLGGIAELAGISVAGDNLVIGAMTTHASVAASADVQNLIPALASLAGNIGDPAVRNRGTIGGSIANNDPAADYPAAVIALGATIKTSKREIAGDEFLPICSKLPWKKMKSSFQSVFRNPRQAAYMKFENPASRYAIVGVFVARTAAGVRVGVTGATPCAHRGMRLEEVLNQDFSPAALDQVQLPVEKMNADIHASAEYRAHLVKVMTKRAVQACN